MDNVVAFARARLELFAVEDDDTTASVPDQALRLHPLRQQRHGRPPDAHHLRQKFLSKEHLVAADAVRSSATSAAGRTARADPAARDSFLVFPSFLGPLPSRGEFMYRIGIGDDYRHNRFSVRPAQLFERLLAPAAEAVRLKPASAPCVINDAINPTAVSGLLSAVDDLGGARAGHTQPEHRSESDGEAVRRRYPF